MIRWHNRVVGYAYILVTDAYPPFRLKPLGLLRPQPMSTSPGWLHNPVTGELARVNVSPADTAGRRMEVDLWLHPARPSRMRTSTTV